MAQRKKRATVRKSKSTVRGKARKVSSSMRGKSAKRTPAKVRPKKAVTTAKRLRAKKVARKKASPMKPPVSPVVETTIVDVVEEPVPGVITVTEFEETDIYVPGAGPEEPEGD